MEAQDEQVCQAGLDKLQINRPFSHKASEGIFDSLDDLLFIALLRSAAMSGF